MSYFPPDQAGQRVETGPLPSLPALPGRRGRARNLRWEARVHRQVHAFQDPESQAAGAGRPLPPSENAPAGTLSHGSSRRVGPRPGGRERPEETQPASAFLGSNPPGPARLGLKRSRFQTKASGPWLTTTLRPSERVRCLLVPVASKRRVALYAGFRLAASWGSGLSGSMMDRRRTPLPPMPQGGAVPKGSLNGTAPTCSQVSPCSLGAGLSRRGARVKE